MHEHYYSEHPQSESRQSSFQAKLRGREFTFYTDRGVFSRAGVDAGSRLLIEGLPEMHAGMLLDLGCGYGAVGIAAAATAPNLRVWMVDVNERAVALAKKNALANRVHERVQVVQGDGTACLPERLSFDWIALNPPIRAGKETVFGLYQSALSSLADGGTFFIVIQKKQGSDSTEKYLRGLGVEVSILAKDKGYRVFACKKSSTFY